MLSSCRRKKKKCSSNSSETVPDSKPRPRSSSSSSPSEQLQETNPQKVPSVLTKAANPTLRIGGGAPGTSFTRPHRVPPVQTLQAPRLDPLFHPRAPVYATRCSTRPSVNDPPHWLTRLLPAGPSDLRLPRVGKVMLDAVRAILR